ncbi:hypothetical protein Fmac_014905 [Flemingia macrophylla]|uniref:Uncharacterized protein n=1 Tax=Flemingia macrophylla TaxID=520843 RepID=A0ABD1MDL4_9FABA
MFFSFIYKGFFNYYCNWNSLFTLKNEFILYFQKVIQNFSCSYIIYTYWNTNLSFFFYGTNPFND